MRLRALCNWYWFDINFLNYRDFWFSLSCRSVFALCAFTVGQHVVCVCVRARARARFVLRLCIIMSMRISRHWHHHHRRLFDANTHHHHQHHNHAAGVLHQPRSTAFCVFHNFLHDTGYFRFRRVSYCVRCGCAPYVIAIDLLSTLWIINVFWCSLSCRIVFALCAFTVGQHVVRACVCARARFVRLFV